jgi:hypothetical protein
LYQVLTFGALSGAPEMSGGVLSIETATFADASLPALSRACPARS